MQSLPELQRAFRQSLVACPPHGDGSLVTQTYLTGRFEIYAEAYKSRLLEALKSNFPALHRVLGDDAFRDLAHRFIDHSPSTYRSIRWFGRELEKTVHGNEGLLPHPALFDLLRMDWALGIAFDAADIEPLGEADLVDVAPQDWAALGFVFHPSLTLLKLEWAVEPIWRAVTKDQDDNEISETPEPLADRHTLLIWRQQLEAKWRIVDEKEALALKMVGEGKCFGELCEVLAADGDGAGAAAVAAQYLKRWVLDRLLVKAQPGSAA
jgi:hypothetical protein